MLNVWKSGVWANEGLRCRIYSHFSHYMKRKTYFFRIRHPSPYYYGDLFLDESEALARRLFASEHERCRRRAMPPRQDDPSDFELSPPPPPLPPPLLQSNHPLPDMARERRLYETAFDSKVNHSFFSLNLVSQSEKYHLWQSEIYFLLFQQ